METKPELNSLIIEDKNMSEPPKKNKKTKPKILIIEEEDIEIEEPINVIINKGTGAGGANTNYYGKKFEEKTNNQMRLLNDGYIKNSFTKNPIKYIITTCQKYLKTKLLYLYYKMD